MLVDRFNFISFMPVNLESRYYVLSRNSFNCYIFCFQIWDGIYSKKVGTYCGMDLAVNRVIESKGNNMVLVFHSDSITDQDQDQRGFHISWKTGECNTYFEIN